jgi:UDP-N-acetylmuramoyl-tripeptide--D-alanyl-D-alanine ligase
MKIRDIVRITRGRLLSGEADTDIELSRISTDSRRVRRGDLFIAIKGPSFDGNDFLEEAFSGGAIGAITDRREFSLSACFKDRILVRVADTLRAMHHIACAHRKIFKIPVIAVTGSNGKTATKEMIWTVLSEKYDILKNEGTKNNHIGLPQTLFQLNADHDICVVELGANHRGEIKMLGDIAQPSAAVITNIGPSHLEHFGDLDGVYKAKREILASLDRAHDPVAVINGDDRFLSKMRPSGIRMIKFGMGPSNDFRAKVISMDKARIIFMVNDRHEFELNLLGTHNIYNALAAISIGSFFGLGYGSMKRAIGAYRPASMRMELENVDGIDIINDSYNSNPSSMERALDVLRNYPARAKWVVSADMMELGKSSVLFHRMIGESIAASKVDGLLTLGGLSAHTLSQARLSGMKAARLWHFTSHEALVRRLRKLAKRGDVVLVKGSRCMKMEEVVGKLKAHSSEPKATRQ